MATLLKKKKILTNELENEIQEKTEIELQEAVKFAEESEFPKPEEALEDMFINP